MTKKKSHLRLVRGGEEGPWVSMITADNKGRVFPVELIQRYIDGEISYYAIDGCDLMFRRICEEWLAHVLTKKKKPRKKQPSV